MPLQDSCVRWFGQMKTAKTVSGFSYVCVPTDTHLTLLESDSAVHVSGNAISYALFFAYAAIVHLCRQNSCWVAAASVCVCVCVSITTVMTVGRY